jgi:hypothetical protein
LTRGPTRAQLIHGGCWQLERLDLRPLKSLGQPQTQELLSTSLLTEVQEQSTVPLDRDVAPRVDTQSRNTRPLDPEYLRDSRVCFCGKDAKPTAETVTA